MVELEVDLEIKANEIDLPRGVERYVKNSYGIEWDIFVKGASHGWLKKMMSYNNVFQTVQEVYDLLIAMDYKVAYGYFKVTDTEYVRSSFFVRDGEVVDTNRHFYRDVTSMEYYTFIELDLQDYIKVVRKEEGDLLFLEVFKERENVLKGYFNRKGIKTIV